jgi:hypothetical protein
MVVPPSHRDGRIRMTASVAFSSGCVGRYRIEAQSNRDDWILQLSDVLDADGDVVALVEREIIAGDE